MTKVEYLKHCILNRSYTKVSWLISVFGIIANNQPKEYLDLTYSANGYSYLDKDNQLVKISDALTQPLFTPNIEYNFP